MVSQSAVEETKSMPPPDVQAPEDIPKEDSENKKDDVTSDPQNTATEKIQPPDDVLAVDEFADLKEFDFADDDEPNETKDATDITQPPGDVLDEFADFDGVDGFEPDPPQEDSDIIIKPTKKSRAEKRPKKSKAEKDAEREQKKQQRERRKEEQQRNKDEIKRRKEEAAQSKQLEKERAEAMMACQRELRESAVKIKDVFGKGGKKSQLKAKQWFDTCCEEATSSSQPGMISAGSFTGSSPTQLTPNRQMTRMSSMIRLTQDETDLGPQELINEDDDSNDFDLVLDIVDDEVTPQKPNAHDDDEAEQAREQQLIERRHELMKFQSSNSIKFDIDVDDSQSQSVMDILERTNSMGYSNSNFIRSRKSMIKTKSFGGNDFSALRARSGKDTSTTVMFKGDESKLAAQSQQPSSKSSSKPGATKLHNLLASPKSPKSQTKG